MTNSSIQIIGRISKGLCDVTGKKAECLVVERPGYPRQQVSINEFQKFLRIVLPPTEEFSFRTTSETISKSQGDSISNSKSMGISISKTAPTTAGSSSQLSKSQS